MVTSKKPKFPVCDCCQDEGSGHMFFCWNMHFCNHCMKTITSYYLRHGGPDL